jgi:hypothetical protein
MGLPPSGGTCTADRPSAAPTGATMLAGKKTALGANPHRAIVTVQASEVRATARPSAPKGAEGVLKAHRLASHHSRHVRTTTSRGSVTASFEDGWRASLGLSSEISPASPFE